MFVFQFHIIVCLIISSASAVIYIMT